MSSQAPVLKNVPWFDYGINDETRPGFRILCSETGAFCVASVLAVWITLLAPQYWKLLAPIWHQSRKVLAHAKCQKRENISSQAAITPTSKQEIHPIRIAHQQGASLREEKIIELKVTDAQEWVNAKGKSSRSMMETITMSRTPEQAITRLLFTFRKFDQVAVCIAILLCVIAFCINTAAAIAPAFLTLDNNALSTSQDCGMWIPEPSSSVANPMGQIMSRVEDYYRSCYEAEIPLQKCDLFPEKSLHVNSTDSVRCPFKGDICLEDSSSIILETGYLPIRHLGMNSPHNLLFRRRAECSVLQTQGYFNANVNAVSNITNVRFYFGNRTTGGDFTYEQNRSVALEEYFSPTGYLVKTVSEMAGQFDPIAELASAKGYVFLAFINTFHVNYPTASYDPIFSATTQGLCPNSNQTCFANAQIPASVLGCIESAELCTSNRELCYDVWGPDALDELPEHDRDGAAERHLVTFALKYSDFGSILGTKHGLLLNATQQIVGTRLSQSLDPQQWKLEVRRLFDMALLRTKFEILAVARGDRAKFQNYSNVMPHAYRGVCGRVKFQSRGFVNFSLLGILCAIFLPALPLLVVFDIRGRSLIVWLFAGPYHMFLLLIRRR